MNFSSQDAAQTLLALGLGLGRGRGLRLGSDQGVGLGLGVALGTSGVGACVRDSDLDWVSDSEPTVFLNTTQRSETIPFNNTRDDYDR